MTAPTQEAKTAAKQIIWEISGYPATQSETNITVVAETIDRETNLPALLESHAILQKLAGDALVLIAGLRCGSTWEIAPSIKEVMLAWEEKTLPALAKAKEIK